MMSLKKSHWLHVEDSGHQLANLKTGDSTMKSKSYLGFRVLTAPHICN